MSYFANFHFLTQEAAENNGAKFLPVGTAAPGMDCNLSIVVGRRSVAVIERGAACTHSTSPTPVTRIIEIGKVQ